MMARIRIAPSQAGPLRWDVFCDGVSVGPSTSYEQAAELMLQLETNQPQPKTMNARLRDRIDSLIEVGTDRATAAGMAYYVHWAKLSGQLLLSTSPGSTDEIVAVCRPQQR